MLKTNSCLLFIIFVTISSPVYAYIDPGTGSIILQGVIASIVLALGTLKFWWYRFTSLFTKRNTDISAEVDEDLDEFK